MAQGLLRFLARSWAAFVAVASSDRLHRHMRAPAADRLYWVTRAAFDGGRQGESR
jgi:hypothetical protein